MIDYTFCVTHFVKSNNIRIFDFPFGCHLQTVSVGTASLQGLLDKILVKQDQNAYMVYDPFFAL